MKQCKRCNRVYISDRDYFKGTSRWRVCNSGHLYFNCSCKSTLIIPAGKFEWYSPQAHMSEKAQSVFNQLSGTETLPRLPEVAMKVQELLADEDSSLENLSKTILSDPFFAVSIIKAANCARMPGTAPIRGIEEAILILGRNRLSELTLPAAMSRFDFKTQVYLKEIHWAESYTTGRISEWLARKYLSPEQRDMAYFAGVFANVGKIVGAILVPDQIDRVFQDTQNLSEPKNWSQAETKLDVFDHFVLGEVAAALWGLPNELLDAIRKHHDTVETSEKDSFAVQHVVAFANQLMHLVRLESHRVDAQVLDSCQKAFKVNDLQLNQMVGILREDAEANQELLAA